MCGLVGAAGDLVIKDETVFKQLLAVDSLRGNDSTGVATINRADVVKIAKQVGDPFNLMEFSQFKSAFNGAIKCLIGHNRYATTGKINKKNAHPFELDGVVGAHNGTLNNKWNLLDHNDFDTDSEALFNHIDVKGLKDAIETAKGAYALTWFDKEKNTINFLRNKERPLFFTFSEDRKKIYWASEKWMLEGVLERNEVKFDPVVMTLEDHHYAFKIPAPNTPFEKIKLVKIKQKEEHFTGGRTGGFSRNSSTNTPIYLPSQRNTRFPTSAEMKKSLEKMYDLSGFIVELSYHSHGQTEHGGAFVQFLCDRYPASMFRVFVKSDYEKKEIMKHDNWQGVVKEIGFSAVTGGFYKIDYSSLKKIEKETDTYKKGREGNIFLLPTFKVKNHKGEEVSLIDFESTYVNCIWCSAPLSYEEKVRIVSDKDCLCSSCAQDEEIIKYLPNLI